MPVIWLVTYIIDPLAAAVALVTLRPLRPARPGAHRLTPLLLLEGGLFGIVGLVLLLIPGIGALVWPWKIDQLLAQVYGAFLLAFAVGGLMAAREARPAAILPTVASTAVLAALTLIASFLHLDRFTPGLVREIWFAGFALVLIESVFHFVILFLPAE